MKKILLFALAAFSANVFSQTITNNDFENWTVHLDPGGSGVVVDSLTGGIWESGNPLIVVFPALSPGMPKGFMYDTTASYSGNHSVAMRTGLLNGLMATGNLFTGVIDASVAGINQVINELNPLAPATTGVPSTDRPEHLRGFFKYYPGADYIYLNFNTQVQDTIIGGGDTCRIGVIVHKWNATLSKRDTIGLGEFSTDQLVSTWTPFDASVQYYSTDTPDSISIVFLSSYGGIRFGGAFGSLLMVDSIYFYNSPLGINDISIDPKNVYAFQDNIVWNSLPSNCTLTLYSLSGERIRTFDSISENGQVSIPENGVLIAKIERNGTVIFSKKLFINK
ncbi:MAG: PCMD domain-containing protein [Crocinitomicaceae bacterium]